MYCPSCGAQIPDYSKFCQECGVPVALKNKPADALVYEEPEPIAESVLEPAPEPTAEPAAEPVVSPVVTVKRKKPTLNTILVIGLIMVAIFFLLGKSVAMTPEEKYTALQEAYHNGEYEACWNYCQELGDYEDTQKYRNLVQARLMNFASEDEAVGHSKKLIEIMDFEDTKQVLVSNFTLAKGYLQGYWSTRDGMHTFEITKGNQYITTIPIPPDSGNTYDIEDGILYSFHKKTPDERKEELKITPISEEKVKIYSYQIRKNYELIKRR